MLILEVVTPVARRAGNARAHLFSRSAAAAEHPEAFAERIAARTSRHNPPAQPQKITDRFELSSSAFTISSKRSPRMFLCAQSHAGM